MGGSLASLLFPLVTKQVAEYPISLAVAGAAVFVSFLSVRRWACLAASGVAAVAAVVLWCLGAKVETRPVVHRARGFFGSVEVLEAKARIASGEGRIHEFVHGTTIHGIQALIPGKERMPTTYYTPNASGYAISGHPKYRKGEPMRVNITGLGVGVLLSSATPERGWKRNSPPASNLTTSSSSTLSPATTSLTISRPWKRSTSISSFSSRTAYCA